MGWLIGWSIALGSVFFYFQIGQALARRDLPRAWKRARQEWSFDYSQRESVKVQYTFMLLFWPVLGLTRSYRARLDKLVDASDPQRIEEDRDRLAAEVARLERENGLVE